LPPPYTDLGLPAGGPTGLLEDGCTLQIATRHVADTVIAMPVGRIDHQSAAQFEAALAPLVAAAAAGQGALVLDLSAIDYISSVGLRVLMIAAKQMRERQARLLVAALQSVVAEIFAISRFDRILTVTATLDDALALSSPAALAQYRSAGSSAPP
jgi:anti-anti-sigma factor